MGIGISCVTCEEEEEEEEKEEEEEEDGYVYKFDQIHLKISWTDQCILYIDCISWCFFLNTAIQNYSYSIKKLFLFLLGHTATLYKND